jgi:uncharacterized protein (TIGR03083 family)
MQREDYLVAIRREGDALLGAASHGGLDSPVPDCPGWAMADLVWHIGEVHNFWATVLTRRLVDPGEYEEPVRPDAGSLVEYARQQLDLVERACTDADPATEIWTWTGRQPTAWVTRRMAHETAVHRVDADRAAGVTATLDVELASDGIDEFLTYFLHTKDTREGAVHLHATDTPGEWIVRFGGSTIDVTRAHEKGDAALRGPAADLLLVLWGREPITTIDVVGDPAAADALLSLAMRG